MPEATREVLLVDDDGDIREVVGSLLETNGYRVHLAEHGADALAQLESIHPDVVLLDVRMPTMDGPEFVRAYRLRRDHAPVVLMSAYSDLEDVASELAIRETLHKPFGLRDLLHVVERLTR